jgi:hypothetical protein
MSVVVFSRRVITVRHNSGGCTSRQSGMLNSPQSTDTPSFQQERRISQRLLDPSHSERSQNVSMRHDQHVTILADLVFRFPNQRSVILALDLISQPIKPLHDLFWQPIPSFSSSAYSRCYRLHTSRAGISMKQHTLHPDNHPSKYPKLPAPALSSSP